MKNNAVAIQALPGWSGTCDLDKLVAGHALATRSILVTANTAEFAGVAGSRD